MVRGERPPRARGVTVCARRLQADTRTDSGALGRAWHDAIRNNSGHESGSNAIHPNPAPTNGKSRASVHSPAKHFSHAAIKLIVRFFGSSKRAGLICVGCYHIAMGFMHYIGLYSRAGYCDVSADPIWVSESARRGAQPVQSASLIVAMYS